VRVVVQRVKHSSVAVDANIVGKINEGLLILLGIKNGDTEKDVTWLANKVVSLRIFEDENGKMNKELKEINGSILLISQFTLYGDCVKGKRPSFIEAAKPEIAIPLYEKFIDTLKNQGINVETGIFGADMKVDLLNDGPVTLVIDSI
jgi:D-tyrosyl-tRNA(Tyr) deacylase